MSWVPPGFGPFESYEADHTLAGGERLSARRPRHRACCSRPGTAPATSPTRSHRRAALRRRALPGLGRAGRPARRRLGHARALDRAACSAASARDRRLSRAHGRHHARARARQQPLPRRAPRERVPGADAGAARGRRPSVERLQGSKRRAAPSTCSASRPPRARTLEARARAILEGAGYERIETPAFEATELFARGVGAVHRHRAQGDVHLRGRRRTLAHAAPRGDRARVPRLRRARHAQAPPAGQALVPVELLSPRARPGGALPAVLAGRRRGARLRRPRRRRRVDRAAARTLLDEMGVTRRAPAPVEPRQPRRAAASTASSCRRICAPTSSSLAEDVRARIDAEPAAGVRLRAPGHPAA